MTGESMFSIKIQTINESIAYIVLIARVNDREITIRKTNIVSKDRKVLRRAIEEEERELQNKIPEIEMNIKQIMKWLEKEPKTIIDEFYKSYAENILNHNECPMYMGYHCTKCFAAALEKLIRKYGISKIVTYEPPTPSGRGEIYRHYEFNGEKWRYRKYVDGELDVEKEAETLYEIFNDWWRPYEELWNILKAITKKIEGRTFTTATEAVFGSSISKPIHIE